MTNERELLELAAKAMGINLVVEDIPHRSQIYGKETVYRIDGNACNSWNPLTNPGDCAEMEAKLGIDVKWAVAYVKSMAGDWSERYYYEDYADYPTKNAARMMASTRAAAEIGRTK